MVVAFTYAGGAVGNLYYSWETPVLMKGLHRSAVYGTPDRSMVVAFTYAGGAVGTLYYSWETPVLMKGLHLSAVYGTEGVASFESNGIFLSVRGRRRQLRAPSLDIGGYAGMWRDFVPAPIGDPQPRSD